MAIVGKYTNTTNEKVAEFFKALGATEEQLAAGAAKNEEKTLEVIDNGGDSYTIDIGPSKSSFKIGEPFENQIMGGKVTVK